MSCPPDSMATLWKGAEVPEAEEDLPKGRWLGRM